MFLFYGIFKWDFKAFPQKKSVWIIIFWLYVVYLLKNQWLVTF